MNTTLQMPEAQQIKTASAGRWLTMFRIITRRQPTSAASRPFPKSKANFANATALARVAHGHALGSIAWHYRVNE
jgi:hypothetical protein